MTEAIASDHMCNWCGTDCNGYSSDEREVVLCALADALQRIEWVDPVCAECGNLRRHGHVSDCAVGVALAAWRAVTKDGDGSR